MKSSRKLLVLVALVLGTLTACAQPKPATTASAPAKPVTTGEDAVIRAAISKAVPGMPIDSIKPSVIPGYREVSLSGKVVYVSADGKYLLQGSLVELASRNNLTDASEAVLRKSVLAGIARDRFITFAPANPKYHVIVFTDIDCGFCRKLHSQIADYNKAGIAVDYLFFPRAGIDSESYDKAVYVWCADDRRKALTDAKLDRPITQKTCANPITADYKLGQKIGIEGTPAVYSANGSQIGGYLSPADMLARLDHDAAVAGGK